MPSDSAPANPQEPPDTPTETDRRLPTLAELCRRRDELDAEIGDHLNQLGRA